MIWALARLLAPCGDVFSVVCRRGRLVEFNTLRGRLVRQIRLGTGWLRQSFHHNRVVQILVVIAMSCVHTCAVNLIGYGLIG